MNFQFLPKQPIGLQLKNQIIEYIIKGFLNPDDKLPSVRELAVIAGVNPNTCAKVYKELEDEGYIYSLMKKGFYVNSLDNKKNLKQELKNKLLDYINQGISKEEILQIIKEMS